MKIKVVGILCLALCMGIIGCKKGEKVDPADMVILNGKVVTMDEGLPQAEAVAVTGDRIVSVGTTANIRKYIGEKTRVLDVKGQMVIPGFIDSHGHYMSLGESLMGIDLKTTFSWDDIVERVKFEVEQTKPGEWIMGRGWHQDKWSGPPSPNVEGLPFHHSLSAVSPDNPVMLIHVSGHAIFVNQKALDVVKITARTPNPTGGEILKDKEGNPTGMLRETAQDVVRQAYADYLNKRPAEVIEKQLRQQVNLAGREALDNGVTTFHDMGETFAIIDLYKKIADEGNLPVRLYVAVQEPAAVMKDKLAAYRMVGYGNNFLTVRMIGEKVLDGALGTHGGLLLEPYSDLPRTSGFFVHSLTETRQSAQLAIKHGFQMAIQGIGDRAARELFDIYEKEFTSNPGQKDLRWRIEHCQVIHPQDMPRFAKLGVIASVRGIFATSDAPWVVKRLGQKRTNERGYQYQRMFQSGAVVINGTDPPVEDIDPIDNFYRSVSRKLGDGSIFLPEQRLTRIQTLRTYTVNGAYAAFEEKIKGSLTPGKLADITILSQDLLTVPDDRILKTEVVYTILAGKVRYQR